MRALCQLFRAVTYGRLIFKRFFCSTPAEYHRVVVIPKGSVNIHIQENHTSNYIGELVGVFV